MEALHTLDETDIEILWLLTEDARRPYREIAEAVNLSRSCVDWQNIILTSHIRSRVAD